MAYCERAGGSHRPDDDDDYDDDEREQVERKWIVTSTQLNAACLRCAHLNWSALCSDNSDIVS